MTGNLVVLIHVGDLEHEAAMLITVSIEQIL